MNRPILKKVAMAVAIVVSCWFVVTWYVELPTFVSYNNSIFEILNGTQFSNEWSKGTIHDEGKFHLVTNIVLVTHVNYSKNLMYEKRRPTKKELIDRQNEIERCLQTNLNHPKVATVHVIYTHQAQLSYLRKLKVKNRKKLVFVRINREPHVIDNLEYAQRYLRNKFVILINQDNYMGEGFEDIDFTRLRNQRLMYALTRHQNSSCGLYATCNEGARYQGSHDAFVFYSEMKFTKTMVRDLDILPSGGGNENLVIWYFRNHMKYKVTNPCKKLKTYHLHCVPIREKKRISFNNNGRSGTAPFTNVLF